MACLRWKYTQTIVMNNNFVSEYLRMQNPENNVAISDEHGYMISSGPYKDYLKTATDIREVGFHSLLKNQGSLTFRLQ